MAEWFMWEKKKKKEKKKEDALITLGCGYFVINTNLNLVPRESKVVGENYFVTAVYIEYKKKCRMQFVFVHVKLISTAWHYVAYMLWL